LNATSLKWKKHWNMDAYITQELPRVVDQLFYVDNSRRGVIGHSMGGHGALTLHFRNPGMFQSVSAFAPMCNLSTGRWGQKAFKEFLGSVEAGAEYDATLLVGKYEGPKIPIMIDQGTADIFIEQKQLGTEEFKAACGRANYPLKLRYLPGYDHGFNQYKMNTFMGDHFAHHAAHLMQTARW